MHLSARTRIALFGVAIAATAVAAVAVVGASRHGTDSAPRVSDSGPRADPVRYTALTDAKLARLLDAPHYLSIRYPQADGEAYSVEVVPATNPLEARIRTKLSCVNVHFRTNRGLCVRPPTDSLGTNIQVLDQHLRVSKEFTLPGTPSRARMSPDGTHGAITNFLSGHSYADTKFVTATTVFDFAADTSSNLEDWPTFNGPDRVTDTSRNFWGVTFLDDNTFYVSMGIRGDRYLLKGDPTTRELRVMGTRMECPSVSPDGKHLTFRRGIVETNGAASMPLFLLNLETMTERRLTFNETVDGQPEWLDNHRITIGTPSGPPNIAVVDINSNVDRPEPWTILVPDALSVSYVNAR